MRAESDDGEDDPKAKKLDTMAFHLDCLNKENVEMEKKNEMELQSLCTERDEDLQNAKAAKLKAKKCKCKGMSGILEEKMNYLTAKLEVNFEDLDSDDEPNPAKRVKDDPKSELYLHGEKKVPLEYFGMALNGIGRHCKVDKAYCNKIVWMRSLNW